MTGDTPVNAIDEMEGNTPSASSSTTTTSPMLPATGVVPDPSTPGSGVKHHRHRHKLKHRYRFDKTLGKGTYGKVKLATEISTGNQVAIKSIPKNKIEDPEDMRRIRQEIELMSTLDHPNIINIYEVFESKEKIVIVMEYASGGELYEFIDSTSIPLGEIQRLFRQIVSALAYCHLNNIVHRDLKLENVLLDQDGDAKIADFGLSSYYSDEDLLHTFCGSPLYASPEIVNGSPYHGPEVDCWSLGVILYAMIYKTMPFGGDDFNHLKRQIMEGRYYDPCPGTVQSQLIRHLLCIDPRYRATIYDVAHHPWVYGEDADEVLAMEYACSIGNRTMDSSRDRESTESSDTEIDGKPPPIPAKPKSILKGSSVEEVVVVAKEKAPEESQGVQEQSSVEENCRDLERSVLDTTEPCPPDLPKSVFKPESDSFLSLASSTATPPSSPEQSSAISINGAFTNLSPIHSETEVEKSAISPGTGVNSSINQSENEVSSSAIQAETEVVKLRADRNLRVQRPATVGALCIGDLPDLPSPRTLMKHLAGDDSVFNDDVVFEGSADDKRASVRLSKRMSCGKYSRITELWESVFNESQIQAMMSTPPSTQSRSKSLKVRREKVGPEESPGSSSCEDLLDILNSQHLKKSYSGSFRLTRHRVASHRRSMRTHKEVAIQEAKKQKQQFQTEPLFAKQEFRKGTRDSGLGDDLENLAKVYQKALEISNNLD